MSITEWKVAILTIGVVLLLLHEAIWEWRWWRIDNTDRGIITPCLPGNHILVSNDTRTMTCQPCRFCSPGTQLSPPCGSILPYDTVIKCKPTPTRILGLISKRKTSSKPELKKASSRRAHSHRNCTLAKKTYSPNNWNNEDSKGHTSNMRIHNEDFPGWPSALDASDIYDPEELQDANLSGMASFNKDLFTSVRTTQDVQGKSTATTKSSLSDAMRSWSRRRASPKFPTKRRTVPRPIPSPPIEANSWTGHITAHPPIPEHMNERSSNATTGSQSINISCVVGGFLGSALAWLSVGTFVVWILFSLMHNTWNRKRRGCRLNGAYNPEHDVEELSDANGNLGYASGTGFSDAATAANRKHLKLSAIPQDLKDLLIKRLDVRRKRERLFGWQKVGAAFKIDKDDLDYLMTEYERKNGSPTSELLLILETRCKTVSDLVNVLRSPKVNLHDVASRVRRYIKTANKSK